MYQESFNDQVGTPQQQLWSRGDNFANCRSLLLTRCCWCRTFIMVSHSPPDMRLPLLKKVAWESIQVGCHSIMLRPVHVNSRLLSHSCSANSIRYAFA
jgi:hypothetical protein